MFNKWRTLKTLQICEKILCCLATSRCLTLLYGMVMELLLMFFHFLFQNLVLRSSMLVLTMLLNNTNLWLTTTLCVFYCVKITNYNHKLFIFLKTRISSLVHWLIIWFLFASLIISVSSSLPFRCCIYTGKNVTNASINNLTSLSEFIDSNFRNQLLVIFLGTCPPFMTFCVENFLLIQSLRMHTRRMRSSGYNPNLESHFHAVKSMSLFLVLHVVYFICMNMSMSGSLRDDEVWFMFNNIISCFFIFLKTKISCLVPWLLSVSLVISVASSLPFGFCVYSEKNFTHASVENSTSFLSTSGLVSNFQNQLLIVFLGTFPPFLTFCVANFLLIQSLRMHTRRMRNSGSSPNLESHFRAVKSMSLFLVLHVVYFICMNLTMSGSLNTYKVFYWISTILCVFYCMKIATYNYKLFVFLKTRIFTMVLWLIL
ncbi:Taste receptor type 2 member 40-like, partial [Pristimantis euphronides]